MLDPRDETMVAVSGGKDSLVLLHILTKIEKSFPDATLCAVTIDEGITGYRDEAVRLAKKHCRDLGIEHILLTFEELYGYTLDAIVNLTEDKGLKPCSFCGVLRRRALNIAARNAGVAKIATAHNLDDETQTTILNLLHGDAMRIARVKPKQDKVHPKLIQRIKPLCMVPEREIAFYAYLKQIDLQSVPCPYVGTALRNDVRTLLNRMDEKHPGIKYTLFGSMGKVGRALEAITEEQKLNTCKVCGEPAAGEICKPCQLLQSLSYP
jgi:uncharacterized protein (TIGR00269 family)